MRAFRLIAGRLLAPEADVPGWPATVGAALAASAILAAWDIVGISRHTVEPFGAPVAVALFAAICGAVATIAVPLSLLRRAARRFAADSATRRAALCALEGVLLAAIVFCAEFLPRFSVEGKIARGALMATGVALALFSARALGRLRPFATAALVLFALGFQEAFSWRERYYLHLGLDLVAITGGTVLLAPLLSRCGRRTGAAALAAAAFLSVAAHPILGGCAETRRLFHLASVHGEAFSLPLAEAFDFDGDGAAPVFGGRDCAPFDAARFPGAAEIPSDGIDENCEGGDGAPLRLPRPSPSDLAGAARGADVVLISLETGRWDQIDALTRTRGALGQHVEFSRAVSPSSRTTHAIGSLLRGRPMREVPFDAALDWDGVVENAPPTIGAVLRRHGWRTAYVPTHVFFSSGKRLAEGFEERMPRGASEAFELRGGDWPVVRAPDAFAAALDAAREADGRFAVWLQPMEAHDPYRWNSGEGPASLAGHRHAFADLDPALAGFLRALDEARPGRPRIVAVFGDHGEEFDEHRYRYHASTVYAEQVRVGFWLSWPGAPAVSIDAPISTAALPATILELLGLPPADSFTVPSVLPCVARGACPSVAVSEVHSRRRPGYRAPVGYTTATHRLVYDPIYRTEELYDTAADPLEQRDVAGADQKALEAARALARAWDESY
jgi:hypothetical protein